VELTAEDTITLNGEILADRDILVTAGHVAGVGAAADSVTIAPTAWLRTNTTPEALALDQDIEIDGYNNVVINGPIGSLQTDEPRTAGDVAIVSQHGDLTVTEQSGWIETGGRIVLTAVEGGIDIAGVIKNADTSAPEPVGEPTAENYEVVVDPATTLTLSGDVDAFGSVLIAVPTDFTLQGSVEAGRIETFEFITEARGFLDGGDERVRIEAPNISIDGGLGTEGADETDEDVHDELSEGQTYPLGAQVVASGLIQLVTPGSIEVSAASELVVRHAGGLMYLEAESVNVLGNLYAGADPNRVLMGEEPGVTWAGDNAGIEILASEMVYFGGENLATDLDVVGGDAEEAEETIMRGGSARATGAVTVTVTGGAMPKFHLNESSFIRTDALPVETSDGGESSDVTITADDGIEIFGAIETFDPLSDVALDSGAGILLIGGFVEAGDQLTLTPGPTPRRSPP